MRGERILLVGLGAAGLAAWGVLERRNATAPIDPRPLLHLVADTERELGRLPLELTRVSIEEERQIGFDLARQHGRYDPRHDTSEDRRIARDLSAVGARLAAQVKRKGFPYRFYYLSDAGCVNAFAMPGGHVFVGRGMLELLRTEDELAAVLGHEIAHVDERHAIERLQYELKSRKLGLHGLYRLGRPAVQLFEAGYAKEKEAEADRAGLELLVAAGYSPAGAVAGLRRLEQLQQSVYQPSASALDELLNVPLQSMQEYFRSHPPPRERLAALEKEIGARGWDAQAPQRPMPVRAIFLAEVAAKLDRRGLFESARVRYREAVQTDPEYLRAWTGLVQATSRSGDAGATVAAAEEALRRNMDSPAIWQLLAEALAVTHRDEAPRRFWSLYEELATSQQAGPSAETVLAAQTDRNGLAIFAGGAPDLSHFRAEVAGRSNARTQARVGRRLAWWMYRAGKLTDAREELEAARQRLPQEPDIAVLLAWVLTDMGRQGDALPFAASAGESAEALAQSAVIHWRTDQPEAAKRLFTRAAAQDPVWMNPRWVQNSYPAAAASVLAELGAAELARREQEAIRTGRRPPRPASPR